MNRQTVADRLREYARTENQQSGHSPPQTQNGGLLAAETFKSKYSSPRVRKWDEGSITCCYTVEQWHVNRENRGTKGGYRIS